VRRIWIGPKLIYHAGATDPETIVASNEAAQGFALYLGTHTQQPDPRIQADVGVANAPAWRGLAYLVFYDLELASYGNSLAGAQVRVEVIQPTATEAIAITTNTAPSASRTMELAWIGESITGIGFEVVSSQYYIERLVATPSTADVAISTTLLPGYGAGKIPHTVRGNPALLVALTAYAGSFLAFFDDQGDEVGTRIRMDSPFTSWAGGESPVAWNASSGRMMMLGSLGAGVSHYASASIGSGVWEALITYAAAPIKFSSIYGCADGQTYAKAPGDLLYRIDADYNVLEGPWTYPTTRIFMDRSGSHFYFCNGAQNTIYEHTFDGSTYNLGSGVSSASRDVRVLVLHRRSRLVAAVRYQRHLLQLLGDVQPAFPRFECGRLGRVPAVRHPDRGRHRRDGPGRKVGAWLHDRQIRQHSLGDRASAGGLAVRCAGARLPDPVRSPRRRQRRHHPGD
jgi:hypothetical protein